MSTHTDTLRQMRRNTATVRGRALSPSEAMPKPSSMTQSFFARGEELEASGYENLAPDDPLLVPPEVEFDSFDKIPRRRGSWFAIGVSALAVAAIGFVTWRSFHYLSKPGSSVAAASLAMVQAPPAATPAPSPAAQQQAMSVVPVTAPAPVTEPPAATKPPPVKEPPVATQPQTEPPPPAQPPRAQPAPIVQPALAAEPAPSGEPAPVRHQPAQRATADEPVHERHAPLRGWVWSPEKHTLVPAEPAAESPLPSEDPGSRSLEAAPANDPQPTPESTSPAPFEPSPAPASQAAPIID